MQSSSTLVFTVIADVWMMELIWYVGTIKNVKSGFISAASTPKFRKGRSGTVRALKIVMVIHDIYNCQQEHNRFHF